MTHSVDSASSPETTRVTRLNGSIKGIAITGSAGVFVWLATSYVDVSTRIAKLEEHKADIVQFKSNVATALRVGGDHGTELETIRQSVSRLEGAMQQFQSDIREDIKTAAADRFTGEDWRVQEVRLAERLAETHRRIRLLEMSVFKLQAQGSPGSGPQGDTP